MIPVKGGITTAEGGMIAAEGSIIASEGDIIPFGGRHDRCGGRHHRCGGRHDRFAGRHRPFEGRHHCCGERYCDRITFFQSPRQIFFALLKPRQAAARPAQPSLHLESPNQLPHLPTPARPSKTIHSSPTPPDASQLTPKNRHRSPPPPALQRPSMGRQQATAPVTEGEYAVNTSTENTSPPSASRPPPRTRVCRHQHRAYWSRQTAHVQTATISLEAGRQICKQQRSPGIKITRGEPSTASASVLVTGHAEGRYGANTGGMALFGGSRQTAGDHNRAQR